MLKQVVEWVIWLGALLLLVNLALLIASAFVHKVRLQVAATLMVSAGLWGAGLWVWCFAIAKLYWGWHPVVLGLLLGGIGVIPVTAFGFFLRGACGPSLRYSFTNWAWP